MNTKKKHKNRPKPTPNQPPKVETEVVQEKIEDVIPKIEVKEEIPAMAPEAIADIKLAVESVDTGCETPKKPKRKTKKKNMDKENEAVPTESVQDDSQDVQSETKTEQVIEEDTKDASKPLDANVTPSARKKKNKKKSQEQQGQQPNISDKECLPKTIEEKEGDIHNVAEIKESVSKPEEIKSETKSKKKNKKKKRTDSEKSDKSEEVTCTSAFQELMKDKPLEKEEMAVDNTTTPELLSDIPIAFKDSPKCMKVESIEKIKECKQTPDEKEITKDETKGKKKNKKDKKRSTEEQPYDDKPLEPMKATDKKSLMELIDPFQTHSLRETSPIPSLEVIPKVKQDTLLEPLPQSEREASPKPKAKIAKPVEKKRKGLQDLQAESLIKSSENLTIMKKGSIFQEHQQDKVSPMPMKTEESKSLMEERKEPEISTTPENILHHVDTLKVSESKQKDKKRRKSRSPKPPMPEERMQKEKPSFTRLTPEPEVTEQKPNESKKDDSASGTENIMLTLSDESLIPLQKSEKVDEVPPLLNIDDMIAPKKDEKKKKKTPKFPAQTEEREGKEMKQLVTPEAVEVKVIPKTDEQKPEKISESSVPDIEIQNVKTDESSSSCDTTPVVQFIRSASHQTLDNNNNNTLIQEVRNVEELKETVPTNLPLVEGSGESPSKTPDLVTSGIRMTERKTTEKEEPTYLKSKMMEVNQDMEELRLSIERSLAEFSAIEKSDEKAENENKSHKVECGKVLESVKIAKPEAKSPDAPMSLPVDLEKKDTEPSTTIEAPPVCPARKDNKGKSKSKKKGKQETASVASPVAGAQSTTAATYENKDTKDNKEKQDKTEQKTESTENKGKQQCGSTEKKGKQQSDAIQNENSEKENLNLTDLSLSEQTFSDSLEQLDFAPIDNFEDALTSSVDDVNKTFEMIVNDNAEESQRNLAANKPQINVTAPAEDSEKDTNKKDDKVNPISQPKNFLGQTDIPAQSNRTDYKKEKNKTPNERQAKVKIKDASDVESKKQSKESQTDIKRAKKLQEKSEKETFTRVKNDNEEYVYKYSFRKVFLQSACHVCHKELVQTRVPCIYCNLVFYCGAKHKDEDWTQHQALCFAVSTIANVKDQKHIYADARHITGQDYRLLRMQTIVSCEKVLKRRLVPWEQEAMLYPRLCGEAACREWRQDRLQDCEGCGQISFCTDKPSHLPKSHQRWCKSYHLYSKLVGYQQTRGRLEPKLPTKVMQDCRLAEKMNEVLASMYEEKIDMNDIQYAALTQLATAPLTAAFCYQLCKTKINSSNGVYKKSSFTIHVVGAELQFEADALNKWEVFFLHLRPDVEELRVVLISPVLNPGELPLDLLGKIRLCDNCRHSRRRVAFSFQDKKNYFEYRSSEEFVSPDLVCAFNPSIQRSSIYNGKDPWPNTINCIIKQKIPFIITGYTLTELRKDIARVKECSDADFKVISEPVFNNFASVRPDRNFISDDEMPLLFKNYCVSVLCGC